MPIQEELAILDDVSIQQGEDSESEAESDAEKSDESFFGDELPVGFYGGARAPSPAPPPTPPAFDPDDENPFTAVLRAQSFGCFRLTPKNQVYTADSKQRVSSIRRTKKQDARSSLDWEGLPRPTVHDACARCYGGV